jgi:hypothetical protein
VVAVGEGEGGRWWEKKTYLLVAEMPEARRIPLNWNALLRLSDLGGFLRKWAFKCAP